MKPPLGTDGRVAVGLDAVDEPAAEAAEELDDIAVLCGVLKPDLADASSRCFRYCSASPGRMSPRLAKESFSRVLVMKDKVDTFKPRNEV